MWRALVYVAVLCLLALGAVWLSNLSGEVTIALPNQDVSIDLPVAAALLILSGLIIALAWWLIATLFQLPFRIGRASRERRRTKGYQALSRGMIAVGAGDTGQARRHAREAQRLLGEQPLTLLLDAQVAQVTGDLAEADTAFRKLVANEDTRLLGLRGLFVEARRQGDAAAAYRHAREAVRLAPAAGWANEAVLEAQCAEGAWSEALEMIDKRVAFGLIDRETAKRQRAVLLTANAIALEGSEPEKALADALRALKYAPTLVPAAVLAGRLLGRRAEVRKAAKILEKAWSAGPHPDIADAYIDLRAGDSAQDRLKRAETLGQLGNWQPEARLALARTALGAREFKRARDILEPLLRERPTIRTCLLMADIEEAEHGAVGHVREWVARAARAPRDPAWIADGVVSDHWAPFSPVSGHIDAFAWQIPPDTLTLPDFDLSAMREDEDAEARPPEPVLITIASSGTDQVIEAVPPTERSAADAPLVDVALPAQPEPDVIESAPVAAIDSPPSEPEPERTTPADNEAETAPAALPEAKEKSPPPPPPALPQPVVFPISHAPDDPGIDEDKPGARAGKR